jgi:guanine nucleotide-binding protein G(i) subunit alpha
MGNRVPTSPKADKDKNNNVVSKAEQKIAGGQRKDIQMYLFGISDSGKSTFVKQSRVMFDQPFDVEDRYFMETIRSAMWIAVSSLCRAIRDSPDCNLGQHNRQQLSYLLGLDRETVEQALFVDPGQYVMALEQLWEDPAVQRLVISQGKQNYEWSDFEFFMERLDSIVQGENYVPTQEDIIKYRRSITGYVTYVVSSLATRFVLNEACGRRSFRRRWPEIYKSIEENLGNGARHVMLYFVSLTGYSEYIDEDRQTSQFIESITLFEEILKTTWIKSMRETDLYLVFTKTDLLKDRMRHFPVGQYMAVGSAGTETLSFQEYFHKEFQQLTPIKFRTIFLNCWDPHEVRNLYERIEAEY